MSEPLDERVEHVDESGSVIQVVSRAEIRAGTLRHRCTYVFVVRTDGRLVVHRRAEWKSIYPGWWDVCFGGFCGVGEPWRSAAERELAEEAGLRGVELQDIGIVRYDEADGRIVGRAYVAVTDEPVEATDGEVVELDDVPLAALDGWLADRHVCCDSRQAALPLLLSCSMLPGL